MGWVDKTKAMVECEGFLSRCSSVFAFFAILLLAISAGYTQTTENMKLRVTIIDAGGKPIPSEAVDRFHILDLSDEPMYTLIVPHDGSVTVVLPTPDKSRPGAGTKVEARATQKGYAGRTEPDKVAKPEPKPGDAIPFQVCMMLNVPKFGEIAVFADGKGKGYFRAGTIDFATEAAATRMMRVRAALKVAESEGVRMPVEFGQKLDQAEKLPPYESLAITLAAGEELTLVRAKHRVEKLAAPRKDFIFGCNAFGYPGRGPVYQDRFKEVFNLGVTNVYLSHFAPTETTRNYDLTDNETAWLLSNGMAVKPCPPFYMAGGVTPEWLKTKSFPQIMKIAHDLIYETVLRYKGKTEYCEIMNEAHDHTNSLRLSPEELTILAKVTSDAAREADPKVKRIINSCHLWGEYVANLGILKGVKRSPYAYMKDCLRVGAEFEIVGLQLYYPEYDLFEIDRLFDRFATLGKPIQITEMGCSSAPGIDPNGMRKAASKGWHGPWTEEMQADWVEAVYTIAYSKPYIEGVTWWDLADAVSFWPYGGLLRGDCSPKPAFIRLKALQEGWGVAKSSLQPGPVP